MRKQSGSEQLDALIDAVLAGRRAHLPNASAKLGALARIAADLRDLPRREFQSSLRGDLERRATMASPAVKPIPEGYRTLTPYLTVEKAPQLLEFLQQAFGAEVLYQGTGSAGGLHSELKIGDSRLMLGGGGAFKGPYFPTSIHLKVDNVDETYARALQLGAVSTYAPSDFDYGERGAGVRDMAGNNWYIATPIGETHFVEGMGTVTAYLSPRGAAGLIDFVKEAFGAEQVARFDAPDGTVAHAKVRIGNSIVEMSDAHGQFGPMPTMFYMYVSDADATYERAIRAGGKSIEAPAEQPYGDRRAAVEDAFGNRWYMATRVNDMPHA
jgi:PhnB protein